MAKNEDSTTRDLKVDKSTSNCCEALSYNLELYNNLDLSNTAIGSTFSVTYINKSNDGATFIPNSISINGERKINETLDVGIDTGDIFPGNLITVNYEFVSQCNNIVCTIPLEYIVEEVKIYKNTSDTRDSEVEQKKFSIPLHSYEPLGIEVLKNTEIEILVRSTDISGSANLMIHDVNNIHSIDTLNVNETKKVSITKKGELFLDIVNVKYIPNPNVAFSFIVYIVFKAKDVYKITPTFDTRVNKISNKVINDMAEFRRRILESPEDGILIISDNARIYIPLAKYVPANFDAITTLNMHEDIISSYNTLVGLSENNQENINKPRRYFVLNTARNEHGGYMSAGGACIDTHPQSSSELLGHGWGIYHEYGHLYDIEPGFPEVSNNLFSKFMAEKYIGFDWLWGNDRIAFENAAIVPVYKDYIDNIPYKGVDSSTTNRRTLYMSIRITESLDDFMPTFWSYYRNTNNSTFFNFKDPNSLEYSAAVYIYVIAIKYKVNLIDYFTMYGYKALSQELINIVIDNCTSSSIFTPTTSNFDEFRNVSLPPTVKGVYESVNPVVTGIANPNATITVNVNDNSYTTVANDNSKFTITIPDSINLSTVITINSTELGKTISPNKIVKLRNDLSDTTIKFLGLGNDMVATVKFEIYEKKLIVYGASGEPHSYFGTDIYFGLSLYDKNGNLKMSSMINGTESSDNFRAELDGKSYELGDYIVLTHKEKDGRLFAYGNVKNAPIDLSTGFGNLNLNRAMLEIREDKLVFARNFLSMNRIEFLGKDDQFLARIEFDVIESKLIVEVSDNIANIDFGNTKYYGFILQGGANVFKAVGAVNGDETSAYFKETLDGQSFEEDDCIILSHVEKATRLRVYGHVENAPRDLSIGFGDIDISQKKLLINGGKLILD